MHETYMRMALEEARQAGAEGEVPVGCVIVREGQVIARGHNRREQSKNALSHAETEAIRQACSVMADWRLSDCTLYVTLEPCPMCAGAILNARVGTVVYGAADSTFGACGGVMNLFEEAFGIHPRLYGGVLAEECGLVLQSFFRDLRKE